MIEYFVLANAPVFATAPTFEELVEYRGRHKWHRFSHAAACRSRWADRKLDCSDLPQACSAGLNGSQASRSSSL